jgi:flagellar protein FlgJ
MNAMMPKMLPRTEGTSALASSSLNDLGKGRSSNPEMLYTELSGLSQIRTAGSKDPKVALQKVAKQFESMLIKMMLSSMRDVNDTLNQGGMFDSNESKMFRQLYDDQLALSLSERGVGLADTFYKQMVQEYLPEHRPNALDKAIPEVRVPLNQGYRIEAQAMALSADSLKESQDVPLNESATTENVHESKPSEEAETGGEAKSLNALDASSPKAFVQSLLPYAQQAARLLGINPKGILAQAALETGWGRYVMKDAEGNSSLNLFGIKADSRWSGEQVSAKTLEFEQGLPKQTRAEFRKYPSLQEMFQDYVKFLQGSPRYERALATNSVETFAQGLQQGGYATDPFYAKKVADIAQREDFDRWITEAQGGLP